MTEELDFIQCRLVWEKSYDYNDNITYTALNTVSTDHLEYIITPTVSEDRIVYSVFNSSEELQLEDSELFDTPYKAKLFCEDHNGNYILEINQ